MIEALKEENYLLVVKYSTKDGLLVVSDSYGMGRLGL